jgi:hypothetical protein
MNLGVFAFSPLSVLLLTAPVLKAAACFDQAHHPQKRWTAGNEPSNDIFAVYERKKQLQIFRADVGHCKQKLYVLYRR